MEGAGGWITTWLVVVVLVFFFLWFGLDLWVFGLLAATLLSAGPWYLVRRLAAARRQKIEDQLADAMVMFSNGIKAGLSLAQSLTLLSEEFRGLSGRSSCRSSASTTLASRWNVR